MDGKIEQRVCMKFSVKLGKSATETLEMFREAFGKHSLRQRFFNGIDISRPGECQLKMHKRSGQPSTSKTTKNLEKIENSSTKAVAEQSMSSQTQLGSVMEFAGRF
jgi:hypothetical protein